VSGHDAATVAFLRWLRDRGTPITKADLGWDHTYWFALEGCVMNRYVSCACGRTVPRAWVPVAFVPSAAGLEVLLRADAAERARKEAA
jgi:hypothetical protein